MPFTTTKLGSFSKRQRCLNRPQALGRDMRRFIGILSRTTAGPVISRRTSVSTSRPLPDSLAQPSEVYCAADKCRTLKFPFTHLRTQESVPLWLTIFVRLDFHVS